MILFIIAAILISFVIFNKPTGWIKASIILIAGILGFFATATLIIAAMEIYARLIFQINDARSWATVRVSQSFHGLGTKALEIIERYETLPVEGLLGNIGRVSWSVHAPLGNVPLQAFQDFLEMSNESKPYLWPIHQHSKFYDKYEWSNSEWLLTNMTHALVDAGWATAEEGKPARLNFTYEEVCREFGVDVIYHYDGETPGGNKEKVLI